jgi:DNA modification methylase
VSVKILRGDVREQLATLADQSVHCVVTSPPYWGLRDYGTAKWEGGDQACQHKGTPKPRQDTHGQGEAHGRFSDTRGTQPAKQAYCIPVRDTCTCGARRIDAQIGLEASPAEFVETMVGVFRDVRRVLMDDGTLWLNLGDSYATRPYGDGHSFDPKYGGRNREAGYPGRQPQPGFKAKDMVGIPWRVAFALQADGWYLRQDIIWAKPNPMPESVRDRCTKSHEYLFLLSKSERYYFDQEAIKERAIAADMGEMDGGAQRLPDGSNANDGRNYRDSWNGSTFTKGKTAKHQGERTQSEESRSLGAKGEAADVVENRSGAGARMGRGAGWRDDPENSPLTRNKRSVWTVATQPFKEAHFATFPPALIEPCILAGCPPRGVVLDPFAGAFTTSLVAERHQRDSIAIELNPAYIEIGRRRLMEESPLFTNMEVA